MHNIPPSGIKRKEYTNVSKQQELYTLFHEQAVSRRGTK